jgi:hypothetical protein
VGALTFPSTSLTDDDAVVDHQPYISKGLEIVQQIPRHDQDVGDLAGLEGSDLVAEVADMGLVLDGRNGGTFRVVGPSQS